MSVRRLRGRRGTEDETFIARVLAGDEDIDAVDDYVDRWHEGDSPRPLYAFLGMTREEYSAFGADERNLTAIVYSRKKGVSLDGAITLLNEHKVAARSQGPHDSEALERFLQQEGLVDEA